MTDKMISLDVESHIGVVQLENGQQLHLPKLDTFKVLKIAKFLGTDGVRLYKSVMETLKDASIDPLERYAVIFESLDEKQIVHIIAIAADMDDEEILKLDFADTLTIIEQYLEHGRLIQAFTKARDLGKFVPEDLRALLTPKKKKAKAEKTPGKN